MSNKESLIDFNFTNILYDAGNVADAPEEILAEYEPEVSELVNKFNEAFCK